MGWVGAGVGLGAVGVTQPPIVKTTNIKINFRPWIFLIDMTSSPSRVFRNTYQAIYNSTTLKRLSVSPFWMPLESMPRLP
jgi:hypothetical protein